MTREGQVRFGIFEADFQSGELRKRGVRLRIQDKPLQILACLLNRPGEVVTRAELQQHLWPPGTFVDFEHGLNSAMNKLREALSDPASNPRFVETLPRRGYRFIAQVESIRPQPRAEGKSILAVMPFQDSSASPGHDYLSQGLSEELAERLGGLCPQQLGVIASTSILSLAPGRSDVGLAYRLLGADFVLHGNVRRQESRVCISLELIEARHQTPIWTGSYDRELSGIGDVQSQMAEQVARALAPGIRSGGPRPAAESGELHVSAPAYQDYLKGLCLRSGVSPKTLGRALFHFEEAVRKSPRFAEAHAALAHCLSLAEEHGIAQPLDSFPKARQAANRAIELKRRMPHAFAAMAFVRHRFDWDFAAAERDYQEALRLNPNAAESLHRYAEFLSHMGRHEEALPTVAQARRFDPLSPAIKTAEAWIHFHLGEYDRAESSCRTVLDIDPRIGMARHCLASIKLQLGRIEAALEEAARANEDSPQEPVFLTGLGVAQALSGLRAEAESTLDRLQKLSGRRFVSPFLQAKVETALGRKESAFKLLEEGLRLRSGWMARLRVDPDLSPLRRDGRFNSLEQRIGFVGQRPHAPLLGSPA